MRSGPTLLVPASTPWGSLEAEFPEVGPSDRAPAGQGRAWVGWFQVRPPGCRPDPHTPARSCHASNRLSALSLLLPLFTPEPQAAGDAFTDFALTLEGGHRSKGSRIPRWTLRLRHVHSSHLLGPRQLAGSANRVHNGLTNGFGQGLIQGRSGDDRYFTFLRIVPGDPCRALFRIESDAGFNYYELLLRRDPSRGVLISDIFMLANGEYLSEIMRRSFYSVAAAEAPRLVAGRKTPPRVRRFTTEDPRDASGSPDQQQAGPLNLPVAPKSVRHRMEMLLFQEQLAAAWGRRARAGGVRSQALWDRCCRHALALKSRYRQRGEYAKAIEHVDAIDMRVGGDPYLDIERGGLLWQAGDRQAAATQYEPRSIATRAWSARPTGPC